MELYCVVSDHMEVFEVVELKIVRETEKYYIFDYNEILGRDMVRKSLMGRMWHYSEKGTAIVTEDRGAVGGYIHLMARQEKVRMREERSRQERMKKRIEEVREAHG